MIEERRTSGGDAAGRADQIIAQEMLERQIDAAAEFMRTGGKVIGLDVSAALDECLGELFGLNDWHPAVAHAVQNQHTTFEMRRQMFDYTALLQNAPGGPDLPQNREFGAQRRLGP